MFGAKIIDAVGEKSRDLSDKLVEKYRTHLGEELLGREEQIAKREAELNNRESALMQREKKLALCIAVPKIYLQVPLTLAVIAMAYLAYREFTSTFGDRDSGTTRSCQERGVAYYKEIGSYPTLSSGENADSKISGMCSRSNMAFAP